MKQSVVRCAFPFILIITAAIYLSGCQTMQGAYDKTREMLGVEKRDIMIGEVKDTRHSLEEVKAHLQAATEKFNTVLNSSEGKLEGKYKTLKSENEQTEKRLGDIQKGIDSIVRVAESMFAEWEAELSQYSSENLRSSSEQRMQEARDQSARLINAMTLANEKAGPVHAAFGDLVLFSRHNINTTAAESLKTELDSTTEKVALLVQEIDASISEADALVNLLAGSEVAQ